MYLQPSLPKPIVITLLVATSFVMWNSSAQAAWQVTDFAVVFYEPDESDVNVYEDDDSPIRSPEEASGGPETSYDDLNDSGRAVLIEGFLKQIAEAYSGAELPEPVGLKRANVGGSLKYLVYMYAADGSRLNYSAGSKNSLAQAVGAECTGGGSGRPGWIWVNKSALFAPEFDTVTNRRKTGAALDRAMRAQTELLYETLAHELFHAVQNEYSDDYRCKGTNDAQIEGSAQAVGVFMAEKQFPGYLRVDKRGIRGEYDYARPWVHARTKVDGNYPYWVSSLFRFIMERFDGVKTMGVLFDRPSSASYSEGFFRDGVVRWLDEGVRDVTAQRMPLALLFPEFVAHHADAAERYGVDETDWLNNSFAGCLEVSLSPDAGVQDFTSSPHFYVEGNSAQCVRVTVTGLPASQGVAVRVVAEDKDASNLDNIHLSVARLTGKTRAFGGAFRCNSASRSGNLPVCVLKPFQGPRGKGKQSAGKARTWLTERQYPDYGYIDNIYLFSNVHPEPRDDQLQPVQFRIALDWATSQNSESGPARSTEASMNEAKNPEPMPIESELGGGGPVDPTMMPFLIQLPGVSGLGLADEGLAAVYLYEFADDMPGDDAAPLRSFSFYVEEPIPFGATGKYPAAVMGTTMGEPPDMIVNADFEGPSGRIEILRFDDGLLHLRVSGEYCYVSRMVNGRCTKTETVSGEIIKAFGWAYDLGQRLVSQDSPGIEQYRALFRRAVNLPTGPPTDTGLTNIQGSATGASASGGGGGGAGASAATAGSAGVCSCSCEEMRAVEQLGEEISASAESNPDGQPDFANIDMSLMSCVFQCAAQYDACE